MNYSKFWSRHSEHTPLKIPPFRCCGEGLGWELRLGPLAALLFPFSIAVSAATAPPTRPAASPTTVTTPAVTTPAATTPMPPDFSPLLERSIFEKGRSAPHNPSSATQPSVSTPESVRVLNGVTKVNGKLMAFVEDRTTRTISSFQVNDPIARGKVTAITLDALTYEADGKSTRVAVGDNLTGQRAAPAATNPSSAPAGGDHAVSPETQSVLERLRQRRQQELKQK